jgi:hypothetical protein
MSLRSAMKYLLQFLFLALAAPALQAQAVSPAGSEPPKQVHWAVGAFFGTGWYRVDDNRSVYVLRIPPRQTLSRASLDEHGNRQLGIEIQYPVSLGLNKLDEIPDFVEFDNYSTISFTPGVQVEVPINRRWSLRPYAHLGYGWESETQEGALIWYGGVKSRYLFSDSRYRWSLLNGLFFAGYKPEFEDRGQYASFMTGLEFNQPLQSFRLNDDPLYLNWHLTYDWFFDELSFHVDADNVESFRDQWELGLALGKRDRPIKIWFMSFEHIGLAYRWSSNANFNAITVNFRSPFTY